MTGTLSGVLGKFHDFTGNLIQMNTSQWQSISWRFSVFNSILQGVRTPECTFGSTFKKATFLLMHLL